MKVITACYTVAMEYNILKFVEGGKIENLRAQWAV
jgi:hypothetical protein